MDVDFSGKDGFESAISYPKQLPVELKAGQQARVRIFMDDPLKDRPAVRLRLRLEAITPLDLFDVRFNGHKISQLERFPKIDRDRGARAPGGTGNNSQWVECQIDDLAMMRQGANVVEVSLDQRNKALTMPLILTHVELETSY